MVVGSVKKTGLAQREECLSLESIFGLWVWSFGSEMRCFKANRNTGGLVIEQARAGGTAAAGIESGMRQSKYPATAPRSHLMTPLRFGWATTGWARAFGGPESPS